MDELYLIIENGVRFTEAGNFPMAATWRTGTVEAIQFYPPLLISGSGAHRNGAYNPKARRPGRDKRKMILERGNTAAEAEYKFIKQNEERACRTY